MSPLGSCYLFKGEIDLLSSLPPLVLSSASLPEAQGDASWALQRPCKKKKITSSLTEKIGSCVFMPLEGLLSIGRFPLNLEVNFLPSGCLKRTSEGQGGCVWLPWFSDCLWRVTLWSVCWPNKCHGRHHGSGWQFSTASNFLQLIGESN